jgi:arabinose-5-phosphate isomerase
MSIKVQKKINTVRQYASQCLHDEAEAIVGLIPQLDDNFDKAVELITTAKEKLSLPV